VAERNAAARAELEGPPCPPALAHVVRWFAELSSARGGSGFGANPISYAEIEAWARLTRRYPSSVEVALLRDVDSAYLRVAAEWTSQPSPASRSQAKTPPATRSAR
jgi:hypothetical protein